MNETEYSIGEIPYSLEKLTINATPNIDTSTLTYLVKVINKVVMLLIFQK